MTNNTFTNEILEKIGLLETIKPIIVPTSKDNKIEQIMLYHLSVNDGTQIYDLVAEEYMLEGLTENMAVSFKAIPLQSCICQTHLSVINENQYKYNWRESNGEEQEFTLLSSLLENENNEDMLDTSEPQNLSELISQGQLFSKKPKPKNAISFKVSDAKNSMAVKMATNINVEETTYFVDNISSFKKS